VVAPLLSRVLPESMVRIFSRNIVLLFQVNVVSIRFMYFSHRPNPKHYAYALLMTN
jgi:hypothetical protein